MKFSLNYNSRYTALTTLGIRQEAEQVMGYGQRFLLNVFKRFFFILATFFNVFLIFLGTFFTSMVRTTYVHCLFVISSKYCQSCLLSPHTALRIPALIGKNLLFGEN